MNDKKDSDIISGFRHMILECEKSDRFKNCRSIKKNDWDIYSQDVNGELFTTRVNYGLNLLELMAQYPKKSIHYFHDNQEALQKLQALQENILSDDRENMPDVCREASLLAVKILTHRIQNKETLRK